MDLELRRRTHCPDFIRPRAAGDSRTAHGGMTANMDLVRDILDAQLVDQNGRNIGRVDGIVLELRRHRPPRFAAMEIGALTLARRIHPRLAWWLRAIALKVSPVPMKPIRVLPQTFRDIGVDI